MSKPSTSNAQPEESEEPSPIDRRLTEGRSYNDGNWSSQELKLLFDAIAKYGTEPKSLAYIAQSCIKARSFDEITVKVIEIRELIAENRDDCRDYHKKIWEEKGYRKILENLKIDEKAWINAIDEIDRNTHISLNKYKNPVRNQIQQIFKDAEKSADIEKDVKVTDLKLARISEESREDIRWDIIYRFINSCVMMDQNLPALNELESSIVLSVLQGIEDEASSISDEEKAIICGMLSDVQTNDFRGFEPDCPCNQTSSVQALVDPLRVRLFGIPEIGAEPMIPEEKK
ncbi:unnamed protein product [Caenorhabditis angaria]|uniref:Uncharacterized protein n=1 Tax=Caenorhabditis angaria TaxID=860376 RepID=A0A9P1I5F7_9PELO|nr:unnamed protein product [Caenorhabditis angaria]